MGESTPGVPHHRNLSQLDTLPLTGAGRVQIQPPALARFQFPGASGSMMVLLYTVLVNYFIYFWYSFSFACLVLVIFHDN